MKNLFLLRHCEAYHFEENKSDHEKELNERGRKCARLLKNWFETSNPSWKVIWMVTNSVQKMDGSIEHWLTTGNEFTDTVDGEEIFMNVIADVNFVEGKIKRINIHNRAKEIK